MQTENHSLSLPSSEANNSSMGKLRRLAFLMRLLSTAFAVWVLWQVISWWRNIDTVGREMGRYLQRDLSAMTSWQTQASMALDLAVWGLLLLAVVYCWRFLGSITRGGSVSSLAPHYLRLCGWLALVCQFASLLCRPVKTYLMTIHLPASEQVFKWFMTSSDFLGILLGLALLMFAYLFTWVLEVVEENRSFV